MGEAFGLLVFPLPPRSYARGSSRQLSFILPDFNETGILQTNVGKILQYLI